MFLGWLLLCSETVNKSLADFLTKRGASAHTLCASVSSKYFVNTLVNSVTSDSCCSVGTVHVTRKLFNNFIYLFQKLR